MLSMPVGWLSSAVKRFWDSWDDITVAMVMLLKEAICGQLL
jgi:hypothetical protein